MTYLLAKYAFLFLLASLFGIALGYWLSRRNMVDVSESYEELRAASARSDAALWDKLWQRLDALPEPKETDLSGVMQRIDAIPQPKEADLSGDTLHYTAQVGFFGYRRHSATQGSRSKRRPAAHRRHSAAERD